MLKNYSKKNLVDPIGRGLPRRTAILAAAAAAIILSLSSCRAVKTGVSTAPSIPKIASRIATLPLQSAPFPHEKRGNGYILEGETYESEGHYDDSSISVFIPAGDKLGGRLDLVVFFHGWFSTRERAAKEFDLVGQFERSGVRALLVMPETGKDVPDSFGGKLEESGGFRRFILELLAKLASEGYIGNSKPGRIILAGHSGAYRVISKIVTQGGLSTNIEEVYLFDGLFGGERLYRDWIAAGRGRFVCVCSEGGDSQNGAKSLADSLKQSRIEVAWADDNPASDASFLTSRVLFLVSPSDHYGVVHDRNEFQRLLASSKALGHR